MGKAAQCPHPLVPPDETELGEKAFAELVKKNPNWATWGGMEWKGKVFINPKVVGGKNIETLSSFLVHEVVHSAQGEFVPGMITYWKELGVQNAAALPA